MKSIKQAYKQNKTEKTKKSFLHDVSKLKKSEQNIILGQKKRHQTQKCVIVPVKIQQQFLNFLNFLNSVNTKINWEGDICINRLAI